MSDPVKLERVQRTYGSTVALHELDLTVRSGELLALLGPNGAGKTTLVSLLMGLRRPSRGTVRVYGHDPREPHARTRIGAMLQESELPPTLRVRELIDLFSRLYPRPLPAARTLNLADLTDLANRLIGTLSGGQKRRLAFALAICGDPDLLFLDEPTVAMDTTSRAAFWNAIGDLTTRGRTIVLTTHYLEEAERTASRVVVIDRGTLLADGTPDEIRSRVLTSTMRLRCALDASQLLALPGVTHVQATTDGRFELRARAPHDVLRALWARGVDFSDLEVNRASLEEAFLDLTRPAPVKAVHA